MKLFALCSLVVITSLTGCANAPRDRAAHAEGSTPYATSGDPLDLRPSPTIGNTSTPTPATAATAPAAPEAASPATSSKPRFTPASANPNYTTLLGDPLAPIAAQQVLSQSVAALDAPTDLWDRIRRGFAMPDLASDLVRDREQWYSSRPDYIFRMTERSKKYLFHIVEELELRNMPTELALLPFIESAFNPQAVSTAKAAGMWQFMPATGKYFELKQNAFRDDRRDVLASTRAALDYLKKLHGMFGDWHLALAAYNWGEGSVGRAIGKNQRAGKPTTYLDLNMPMETRFYVPKLQAVKNIVARPEAFASSLPVIENHPYFQSVTIRRDIDLALAARLAEVPLDDFKALNPSINRPVIMAAGTPQILMPWDNAEVFQRNLEAHPGRLASWTVWIAPTTMRPAEAAKRAGMSEAELRSVNAIPQRMVIRAGSTLLVPRSNHIVADVTERVADTGQMSLAPEVVQKRTVLRAGKGDSVANVARRYKLDAAQVAQWNKVSVSASFKPGQQIVIYQAPGARKRANVSAATSLAASKKASTNRSTKRTTSKK